jgi:hypothetical protein
MSAPHLFILIDAIVPPPMAIFRAGAPLQATCLKILLGRDHSGTQEGMQLNKEMKEIAKKYSLNKKGAERLFRVKPQVFIPNTHERTSCYIQALK